MKISTFFDFCSGIGGGRLGLEQCGLTCVGHSDTSRLADITYRFMHGDNDKNYGNLRKLTKEKLPAFDLLIAGFPCQTFSVIGRKEGFSDNRGQIIFQLSRIISETKPKCFILENVKGLVTHNQGKTLETILSELRKCGYSVTYRVLTSLDYGVPQMRQRVYFVGFRNDICKDASVFEWPESKPSVSLGKYLIDDRVADDERLNILGYYLNNPTNAGKYTIEDLCKMEGKILDTRMNDLRIYSGKCPTLRAQRDGILYVRNGRIYQLTGYEALLLQGFPTEHAMKVKNKVSDRHLLMQAGNAMTVNVIREIGNSILDFLTGKGKINMSTWEDFEIESVEYLNRKFGEYATFIHKGGADSTVPDIQVHTKTGKTFYIDAKHSPAQCGQFVLLPNIKTMEFDYSTQNASRINIYARKIMEYMNGDFDGFREAGTSGKDINMPDGTSVFSDWIIQTYREKGTHFFITNEHTILSIEHLKAYFNIWAKYRVKRSGSSSVGKSRIKLVSDYLQASDYHITNMRVDEDKIFVESDQNLHNQRFILQEYEYMLSARNKEYEIRKLSNTYNANVIFSIEKNSEIPGMSDEDFISFLKQ